MQYSKEEIKELEKMLADHQQIKKTEFNSNQELEIQYEQVLNQSVNIPKKSYQPKKKKLKINIKKTIASILVVASLATTAYLIKTDKLANPIKKITESVSHSELIDEKINDYMYLMINDSNYVIETSIGRDTKNENTLVAYNFENIEKLANLIVESAKISEEDARCTILAAYKIINEPYRTETLDKAFKRASAKQEETRFVIPSSTREYFELLGYEDIQDYHNNERENIKGLEEKKEGRVL